MGVLEDAKARREAARVQDAGLLEIEGKVSALIKESINLYFTKDGNVNDYGFYNGKRIIYRTDPNRGIFKIFIPENTVNLNPEEAYSLILAESVFAVSRLIGNKTAIIFTASYFLYFTVILSSFGYFDRVDGHGYLILTALILPMFVLIVLVRIMHPGFSEDGRDKHELFFKSVYQNLDIPQSARRAYACDKRVVEITKDSQSLINALLAVRKTIDYDGFKYSRQLKMIDKRIKKISAAGPDKKSAVSDSMFISK